MPWTYACRKGKGRIAALDAAARHCRKYTWYLNLDIRKYFDSVPHDRLLERLRGIFKDAALLRLLEGIIRSYGVVPRRGLTILGTSRTSQHFANLYLDGLDRFIEGFASREEQECVRYMVDLVVFAANRESLTPQTK